MTRGRKSKYDEATQNKILELVKSGKTYLDVGKEMKIGVGVVRYYAMKNGVYSHRTHPAKPVVVAKEKK